MTRRAQPEHAAQVSLFEIVSTWTQTYPALALLYAVGNGGHRNKVVAAKMKREGVKAGVPDLVLPVPLGGYGALYLEMKSTTWRVTPTGSRVEYGTASKHQIEWAKALMQHGNAVAFCWSTEDAFRVLLDYVNCRFIQKPEPWKRA